jgi:uncharacterized membrane protein
MSNVDSHKNLAGIGSILLIFPFLSIVGIILVFFGMKGLSEDYKEPSIYQNVLWGVIFGIIASVVFAAGIILAITVGIFAFGIGTVLIGLATLVVVFVFYVMMAMYFKRAFSTLAQKTGEHSFETAGNLLWIGAILTIIFVGFFLIFIAWIFATIGFFSIKNPAQSSYSYTPPPPVASPPSTATQTARFCPNCGAPVQPNATFCPNCGKPLPT